jgi:hypothetical protein
MRLIVAIVAADLHSVCNELPVSVTALSSFINNSGMRLSLSLSDGLRLPHKPLHTIHALGAFFSDGRHC